MNMTMQEFFSKCGAFSGHYHPDESKLTVQFDYENGYSLFDGRSWTYWIACN